MSYNWFRVAGNVTYIVKEMKPTTDIRSYLWLGVVVYAELLTFSVVETGYTHTLTLYCIHTFIHTHKYLHKVHYTASRTPAESICTSTQTCTQLLIDLSINMVSKEARIEGKHTHQLECLQVKDEDKVNVE